MLVFIKDNQVKVWFQLWKLSDKYNFLPVSNERYPLEYSDSRFHRALEKLRSGFYVAVEVGKNPKTSKLPIDYSEAEKHYQTGIIEPPKYIPVDWDKILSKVEGRRYRNQKEKDKKEQEEIIETVKYYEKKQDSLNNRALKKAVNDYKNGKKIPRFLEAEVLKYLAQEYRNQFKNKGVMS